MEDKDKQKTYITASLMAINIEDIINITGAYFKVNDIMIFRDSKAESKSFSESEIIHMQKVIVNIVKKITTYSMRAVTMFCVGKDARELENFYNDDNVNEKVESDSNIIINNLVNYKHNKIEKSYK